MHVGGAFSKVVVRAAEPSAGGHGVSPVIEAPAGGTVTAGGATVSDVDVSDVDGPLEAEALLVATSCLSSPPKTRESTKATTRTPTIKRPTFRIVRFR